MGFEKAQQYLVKKYKAKNWDDLVYNKQATDMDAEDVETIKRLIEKREEIRKIANMRTNTIELEPSK